MRLVASSQLLAALMAGVAVLGLGPGAFGQACTCDLANADLAPCGGPDGSVNIGDIQFVDFCIQNQADFCGRDLSVCDINCDGAVDYRDYGEAVEAFFTGVASGPCVGIYGGCCGINQTSCVVSTSRGCELLNVDAIPGDGAYAGDGTECSPNPCDCNGNSVADSQDLADGTSVDCNKNRLLDECDIANAFSFDIRPPNNVPDECDPLNRYLFFRMNDLVPAPTLPHAIRVTLVNVNGFGGFNSEVRWAGPATDAPDEDASDPLLTFKASTLQCTSHYADWGTSELVYIAGGDIVPGSTFTIQAIPQGCSESVDLCYTDPSLGELDSALWGDVTGPHPSGGTPQPDFVDISVVVEKFTATAGAVPKPRAQLLPNTPFPDRPIDFNDIAATVSAFIGESFEDVIGSGVGPCTCPSAVTCGATSCTLDTQCGDGFCVDNGCTDPCKRCSP